MDMEATPTTNRPEEVTQMDHKLIKITAVVAVPDYGGKSAVCARDYFETNEAYVIDWNETEMALVEETGKG